MSAHTPGPWTLVAGFAGHKDWISVDGPSRRGGAPITIHENRNATALDLANARLIAAAPDLLAACERVIDALKDHVLISPSMDGARTQGREICSLLNAAIAKARGE